MVSRGLAFNEHQVFIFNLISLTTTILLIGFGSIIGDQFLSIALLSFGNVILFGGVITWLMKLTGVNYNNTFKIVLRSSTSSLILALSVLLVKMLFKGHDLIVLSIGVVSVLIYFIFVFYSDNLIKDSIAKLVPTAKM